MESGIKNLHNTLLKYSQKDEWHKGDFKQHTNAVQASFPDGTNRILFETTEQSNTLSPKEKSVYVYVNEHPKCKSKDITTALGISKATVKRILIDLMAQKLVGQYGKGAGIYYSAL